MRCVYLKLQLHDRIKWAVRRLLANAAMRRKEAARRTRDGNSTGNRNSSSSDSSSSSGGGLKEPMVSWDWTASVSDPMEMIHKVVLPAVASLAAAPMDLLDDASTGASSGRHVGTGGSSNVDLLTELSDTIEAHQLYDNI